MGLCGGTKIANKAEIVCHNDARLGQLFLLLLVSAELIHLLVFVGTTSRIT